jgi:hypothetical protein
MSRFLRSRCRVAICFIQSAPPRATRSRGRWALSSAEGRAWASLEAAWRSLETLLRHGGIQHQASWVLRAAPRSHGRITTRQSAPRVDRRPRPGAMSTSSPPHRSRRRRIPRDARTSRMRDGGGGLGDGGRKWVPQNSSASHGGPDPTHQVHSWPAAPRLANKHASLARDGQRLPGVEWHNRPKWHTSMHSRDASPSGKPAAKAVDFSHPYCAPSLLPTFARFLSCLRCP